MAKAFSRKTGPSFLRRTSRPRTARWPVRLLAVAVLLVFLRMPAGSQSPAGTADLILHNAKVLTVDSNFSVAEAVAVRGNQIAEAGSNADVLKLRGPNTQVIDLKGRTVVPGLIDTHRHMYSYAERTYGANLTPEQTRSYPVDWRGVTSKDDVLNQVKNLMDRYKFKPGEWVYLVNQLAFIRGGTVEQAKILYDQLNRWELDKVTPDNPVIMSMGIPNFMGMFVNSKAFDIIWAEHEDFIKRYGRYWVDANGRPDGHLEPPASRLPLPYTYNRDPAVLAPIYKAQMEEEISMGMTTVSSRMPQDTLRAYQLLESRGELTQRIAYGMIEAFGTVTDFDKQMPQLGKQIGTGSGKIWMTGIGPTAVDGVTTRACTDQKRIAAYGVIDSWFPSGQCHYDIEYRGAKGKAAPISGNYYRDWTLSSARHGVRFANTHVAGDKSHRLILNLVEEIQEQYGPEATKGWGVDHCDMVNPDDFARGARLGVFFSCYVARSVSEGEEKAESYGEEIAHKFLSPVKSLLDAGAKVVLESDTNSYLWEDIEITVTRKDDKGRVWGPQERVDRQTALKMITRWAAEYVLRGEQLGSIERGKIADLVVLDRDFLTVPEEEISDLQPQITVLDGKIVYVHRNFAGEYNLRPAGALVSTYSDLAARRAGRRSGGG